MANIFGGLGGLDGLVKGLANLAPQDNPDVKLFNAQNELKALEEKENAIYLALGKKVYAQGGKATYPEVAVQLEAIAANRTELQGNYEKMQAEKAAKDAEEAKEAEAKKAAEAGRTCTSCGLLNPEGTKFCQECGAKLPGDAIKYCVSCGVELKPGMRFCGACGARQGE